MWVALSSNIMGSVHWAGLHVTDIYANDVIRANSLRFRFEILQTCLVTLGSFCGKMTAKIQHYKEELNKFLNQDNAFGNALAKVEEKTKVNRLNIFLGNMFAKSFINIIMRPQDFNVGLVLITLFVYFRCCRLVLFVSHLWLWCCFDCERFGRDLPRVCIVSFEEKT